jgi:hypothetical protein
MVNDSFVRWVVEIVDNDKFGQLSTLPWKTLIPCALMSNQEFKALTVSWHIFKFH